MCRARELQTALDSAQQAQALENGGHDQAAVLQPEQADTVQQLYKELQEAQQQVTICFHWKALLQQLVSAVGRGVGSCTKTAQ